MLSKAGRNGRAFFNGWESSHRGQVGSSLAGMKSSRSAGSARPRKPSAKRRLAVGPDVAKPDRQGESENIVPARTYQARPLVGLGGSAGSITALQKFFSNMPPKSGMSFVVVMHLSPEH